MAAETDPVAVCIAAAAARLAGRRDELTAGLLTLFAAEIAPLQHDDELLGLLAASTEENVVTALHVLQHGIDPLTLEAPTAALQYARRLAQRSIPLAALLRSYRLGQARFLEAMLSQVDAARDLEPGLVGAAAVRLSQLTTAYIDRVGELMVTSYETEREAWLTNRSALRVARVMALLADDGADVAAAEQKLGYRLRQQTHVGLHLWSTTATEDLLLHLERVANAVAAESGGGRPLFVPSDAASALVWVPGTGSLEAAQLRQALRASPLPLRVAVGEPGRDVVGFRSTHRQAAQAKAVAVTAGVSGSDVTLSREVGAVALLCGDLRAARLWVRDTLGGLAADDENGERLRETLHVFLTTGCSYTASAELLSLHKNSVQYRVQKAEQLRGRPVREQRADLELALRASRVLGPVLLRDG